MRILISVILGAFIQIIAVGQSNGIDPDIGNPGLNGRNSILGHVYYPSGHPLDRRVRVRVTSVRGGPSSVMTDDNGAFTILRLPDGTYNLTIEAGPEFETLTESVQIIDSGVRGAPGQTLNVQLHLQYKAPTSNPPAVLNAALANIPKPARDLYEQALAASNAGDHKKAIENLKKAVSIAPDFLMALNELGMQYLKVNELNLAHDSLVLALRQDPEPFILHLNYGLILLQRKQFDKAEAEMRIALDKSNSSAPAHEYLGRALIGLQRLDEAEKELKRALELGGEQAFNAHRYLGAVYMQKGEDEKAIAELKEYLRLQPKVKDAEQIKQIIKDLSLRK